MKCPNCGVNNGKTSKYCRECGTRLDVLAPAPDSQETHKDEVALGEELFRVIELFEAGDIDAALEKGAKAVEEHPDSTSAHSIVALVYERKAEQMATEQNEEESHRFLRLAIEHYEKLIDHNPDSAADREKLASLRFKLTGVHTEHPVVEAKPSLEQRIRRNPALIWIPGVAFCAVLFLAIYLTKPAEPKPRPTGKVTHAEEPAVEVTQDQPEDPGLKVYTFPQAAHEPATPSQKMPVPSVNVSSGSGKITIPEIRPAHLPKIDQTLTLIADPKPPTKKPSVESAKPADRPTSEKEVASQSGAGLLAQAIRLHDQGKVSEAVGAANQAVVLYQADVDAGRNAEAASRGIKNAHKLISVWQESGGDSSDM